MTLPALPSHGRADSGVGNTPLVNPGGGNGGGNGNGNGSGADFVEDFSTYTSTSDMLSDPRDIYMESDDRNPSRITLDQSVGVDVDGHDLDQSMRYDWPDRTGDSDRCSGFTISRRLDLRDTDIGRVQHIWVEFYIRWEESFTVEAPDAWDCNSSPRLKTFFVNITGDQGRYGLTMGPSDYRFQLPGEGSSQFHTQDYADESWHQVRVEVILPVSDLAPADGGEARWWVDGELAAEYTEVQNDADDIWALKHGANMNQGPDHEQSNWYGRTAVWTEDPGW